MALIFKVHNAAGKAVTGEPVSAQLARVRFVRAGEGDGDHADYHVVVDGQVLVTLQWGWSRSGGAGWQHTPGAGATFRTRLEAARDYLYRTSQPFGAHGARS